MLAVNSPDFEAIFTEAERIDPARRLLARRKAIVSGRIVTGTGAKVVRRRRSDARNIRRPSLVDVEVEVEVITAGGERRPTTPS
ncbi:MAG: hypothetical protein ABW039_12735 [Sphingobium sp.]